MVSWLTSQFQARPKPQPKKGAPIASYTMGTDPTALGGNARGHQRLKSTLLGHSASHSERLFLVESECGAVAVGRTYLLPPLSSGGASLVRPWLRFHTHRVTGGGRPPPVPTERGVRISRTNALRQLLHSIASACSSR